MSAIKELVLEIQAMAHDMGDDFGQDADTVLTLSRVFGVNIEFVELALADAEAADADYDDSMDGDFDSAMASAGYGTDEDYGYYGE